MPRRAPSPASPRWTLIALVDSARDRGSQGLGRVFPTLGPGLDQ